MIPSRKKEGIMLCSKCHLEKDESYFDFRKDRQCYRTVCKECRNKSIREKYQKIKEHVQAKHKASRAANKEHYARQARERYWKNRTDLLEKARNRPNYGKVNYKKVKEWCEQNKEKVLTHRKVKYALANKSLIQPLNCQLCGKPEKLQAHHNDYSKPLEVLWLCNTCHRWIHSKHAKETLFAHLEKQD